MLEPVLARVAADGPPHEILAVDAGERREEHRGPAVHQPEVVRPVDEARGRLGDGAVVARPERVGAVLRTEVDLEPEQARRRAVASGAQRVRFRVGGEALTEER